MKPRHKRVALVVGLLASVGAAAALVLNAFNSNLVFFYTPSQIALHQVPQGRTFRLGGLVQTGTVVRNGVTVRFLVTDTAQTVPVRFKGVLPDLFKEGKGVVAQGTLGPDGVFVASEVLAKHDENYMPPEAADAIAKANQVRDRMAGRITADAQGAPQ
ncbi:MAG: cytochrome c maturation protein CcmE [Burkholderiales bacterium]|nr:cytochrome c maturation protein CcmE [Burkholderiales bacterium]MDE1928259.1 cytochrome c maturation protein CcmE [Burkholderiales bacterium]MDE2158453.1 cytochrome c maturation protein CcmE [Burkholderiales bacterium]MDE2505478.1 cytochrome c maturation protein CcmE [Burkholderiales bacterium]